MNVTVSTFTPDDPLALVLTAVAGLIILAALAYTNWRMRH